MMLKGGACDVVVALQLNWPLCAVRKGLNSRLLVTFPGDLVAAAMVMPLLVLLEMLPSGPNHSMERGLVMPSGYSTVQVIV